MTDKPDERLPIEFVREMLANIEGQLLVLRQQQAFLERIQSEWTDDE